MRKSGLKNALNGAVKAMYSEGLTNRTDTPISLTKFGVEKLCL